jgi:hypothetical protein
MGGLPAARKPSGWAGRTHLGACGRPQWDGRPVRLRRPAPPVRASPPLTAISGSFPWLPAAGPCILDVLETRPGGHSARHPGNFDSKPMRAPAAPGAKPLPARPDGRSAPLRRNLTPHRCAVLPLSAEPLVRRPTPHRERGGSQPAGLAEGVRFQWRGRSHIRGCGCSPPPVGRGRGRGPAGAPAPPRQCAPPRNEPNRRCSRRCS